MTTLSGHRLYQIFQGTPTTEDEEVTILGLGPTGDATARRRLVHPDSANFEPILYFQNPDRTINLDNEVLRGPLTAVLRTLEGSAVSRFDQIDSDTVITEIWIGSDQRMSMPAFLFRQLYEYLVNPPEWVPSAPIYIQWSPQDKNPNTYNVELLRLAVGSGGDPSQSFDVNEFFPKGSGVLDYLDEAFENEGSGLLDRTVVFQFKIVSEV